MIKMSFFAIIFKKANIVFSHPQKLLLIRHQKMQQIVKLSVQLSHYKQQNPDFPTDMLCQCTALFIRHSKRV